MFLFDKSPNALFLLVVFLHKTYVCFRSHKMLQQVIIVDGDDVGRVCLQMCVKCRQRDGENDTKANREAIN